MSNGLQLLTNIDFGYWEAWATYVDFYSADEADPLGVIYVGTRYMPPVMCQETKCWHIPQAAHWDQLKLEVSSWI